MLHGISATVMAVMVIYILQKGVRKETRLLALLPAGMGLIELLGVGVLTPSSYPILTIVALLMKLVVIGCCVGAVRRDMALVRARQRRRQWLKQELHKALQPALVPVPCRQRPTTAGQEQLCLYDCA